jgi:hypothetical protein
MEFCLDSHKLLSAQKFECLNCDGDERNLGLVRMPVFDLGSVRITYACF